MKNTLLFTYNTITITILQFANRKYEELSYPKNQRMCDPILVSLLKIHSIIVNPVVKMRPHPVAHAH